MSENFASTLAATLVSIIEQLKDKGTIKTPSMWKVIIINDDFTPVDFVISLIQKVFNKNIDEATKLTYLIHNAGKANIAVYTKEVAISKAAQVGEISQSFGHPLRATAEEA